MQGEQQTAYKGNEVDCFYGRGLQEHPVVKNCKFRNDFGAEDNGVVQQVGGKHNAQGHQHGPFALMVKKEYTACRQCQDDGQADVVNYGE